MAGVKAVTLQDTAAVELSDLGAHFYLAEGDVGKNRAEACAAKLQELNPAVDVTVVTVDITDDLCKKHQVRSARSSPIVWVEKKSLENRRRQTPGARGAPRVFATPEPEPNPIGRQNRHSIPRCVSLPLNATLSSAPLLAGRGVHGGSPGEG